MLTELCVFRVLFHGSVCVLFLVFTGAMAKLLWALFASIMGESQ